MGAPHDRTALPSSSHSQTGAQHPRALTFSVHWPFGCTAMSATATGHATKRVASRANFRANIDGTALDANDFIVYDTDSGALWYDANGNGAGGAIQFAQLTPGVILTNLDFVVI